MRYSLPLATLIMPAAALADVPNVVTDIAPIHSIVTQVMDGVGKPSVLVAGGATPHDFQFTFAQAGALQDADLVIWMGEGLTPWLEVSLATLAPDTPQLELLAADGWVSLPLREWDDGHDHAHGAHDDHDKASHDDHDHAEADHEAHDHDTHDHDGHDHDGHENHDRHDHVDAHDHAHGDTDPHAWLDPINAMAWTDAIAAQLIALDPDNATLYRANAATTKDDLLALGTEIESMLAPLAPAPYLVPHDAYQYFETRFNLPATGAISLSDATTPSPGQIEALRSQVADGGVVCVLRDPQSRSEWVDLVREGGDTRTALADPMGTAFAQGPNHYRQTLTAIAQAYVDCLGD